MVDSRCGAGKMPAKPSVFHSVKSLKVLKKMRGACQRDTEAHLKYLSKVAKSGTI